MLPVPSFRAADCTFWVSEIPTLSRVPVFSNSSPVPQPSSSLSVTGESLVAMQRRRSKREANELKWNRDEFTIFSIMRSRLQLLLLQLALSIPPLLICFSVDVLIPTSFFLFGTSVFWAAGWMACLTSLLEITSQANYGVLHREG